VTFSPTRDSAESAHASLLSWEETSGYVREIHSEHPPHHGRGRPAAAAAGWSDLQPERNKRPRFRNEREENAHVLPLPVAGRGRDSRFNLIGMC